MKKYRIKTLTLCPDEGPKMEEQIVTCDKIQFFPTSTAFLKDGVVVKVVSSLITPDIELLES